MNIKMSLTERQAKIVRAVSKLSGLEPEAVVATAAFVTLGMAWDDADSMVEELHEQMRKPDSDRLKGGRLPCGLEVERCGPPPVFVERVIEAECRKIARMFREDPRRAGLDFDPDAGVIRVKHGGAYRWTGKKIAAVAA